MRDIGPGDWVECICAGNTPGSGFVVGGLYCVSEVGGLDYLPWINCAYMPTPSDLGYGVPGWDLHAFRPLRDGQERIERKAIRRSKTKEPA